MAKFWGEEIYEAVVTGARQITIVYKYRRGGSPTMESSLKSAEYILEVDANAISGKGKEIHYFSSSRHKKETKQVALSGYLVDNGSTMMLQKGDYKFTLHRP